MRQNLIKAGKTGLLSYLKLKFQNYKQASRALPLRWHLVLLVTGTLFPVVLFTATIVYRLSAREQAESERSALWAARNLSGTFEREISSTIRTLQALTESEELDSGNLSTFDREIRRAILTQPTWLAAILATPDGQQLINTQHPFGTALPPVNELRSLEVTAQTRQPTVGSLVIGRTKKVLAFPIRVPVIRDGKLKYILSVVITPKALASVVEENTRTDKEWTRTIVDGQGTVVARTRNPERFVGQKGTPSFLKRISESSEGVYRDTTLEGVQVYVAFNRTDFDWTTAVTIPVDVIEQPARQAIWMVIGAGCVFLLCSGVGAVWLSQRISRSINLAASAAEELAQAKYPHITTSSIQEVNLLSKSLEYAAELLLQREQERDRNLAQAQAAQAEAETANRLKDEFLATVSHELRTPLNAILGWAALLRGGRLDAAKTQQAIAIIERNAKAQTQLIEDLFDTSRIIRGKLHLETQPLNLAYVVGNAIESIRPAAEAKDIEITLHISTETGLVLGDPNRLQQVVWNLVSNAIKFTPKHGRVEVNLREIDEMVEIAVCDTGIGIKAEFLPYVFDRFRQFDGSTTREFGGLGLGLAIVRHLVELHGGTVHVSSNGEGQGSVFKVQLPLIETTPPTDSAPQPEEPLARNIDDSAFN